jgi:hypothetical protein
VLFDTTFLIDLQREALRERPADRIPGLRLLTY